MTADLRALLARTWDGTDDAPLEHLADAPVPPGYAMWRLGRSTTVLPALLPTAPMAIVERYMWRVLSNVTATCPVCGQVAEISYDPERAPAAWHALPVTVAVRHVDGCPAVFGEEDREWFDPRAVAR